MWGENDKISVVMDERGLKFSIVSGDRAVAWRLEAVFITFCVAMRKPT